MAFKQIVEVNQFYIEIGIEKWVMIPDGYDGIALNRGRIRVLPGGRSHHLAHVLIYIDTRNIFNKLFIIIFNYYFIKLFLLKSVMF